MSNQPLKFSTFVITIGILCLAQLGCSGVWSATPKRSPVDMMNLADNLARKLAAKKQLGPKSGTIAVHESDLVIDPPESATGDRYNYIAQTTAFQDGIVYVLVSIVAGKRSLGTGMATYTLDIQPPAAAPEKPVSTKGPR